MIRILKQEKLYFEISLCLNKEGRQLIKLSADNTRALATERIDPAFTLLILHPFFHSELPGEWFQNELVKQNKWSIQKVVMRVEIGNAPVPFR